MNIKTDESELILGKLTMNKLAMKYLKCKWYQLIKLTVLMISLIVVARVYGIDILEYIEEIKNA